MAAAGDKKPGALKMTGAQLNEYAKRKSAGKGKKPTTIAAMMERC